HLVTTRALVGMMGDAVKRVGCTTCDADHDFKHAKVPRQRRKSETPAALYAQVLATGPKVVTHDQPPVTQTTPVSEPDEATEEDPIESPAPALAAAVDEAEAEPAQ